MSREVEMARSHFLEVEFHFVIDEIDEVLPELAMLSEVDGVDLIEGDLLLMPDRKVTDLREVGQTLLWSGLLVVEGLEVVVGSFRLLDSPFHLLHFVSLELEGLEVVQVLFLRHF